MVLLNGTQHLRTIQVTPDFHPVTYPYHLRRMKSKRAATEPLNSLVAEWQETEKKNTQHTEEEVIHCGISSGGGGGNTWHGHKNSEIGI